MQHGEKQEQKQKLTSSSFPSASNRVMEVVTGALPSVITKLGELLIGEYNLQRGVKGDIRFRPSVLHPTKMISADICRGKG